MAKNTDYYKGLMQEMVDDDSDRDKLFRDQDKMYYNDWSLPPELAGLMWIHKVVTTDPHDALSTATKFLSAVKPKITYTPLAGGELNQENADNIEQALRWHLESAARRPRARPVRDIVQSALRYDEVTCQVVYLPWQIKMQGRKNPARIQAMKRMGPFAVIVHNPKYVHSRYSDLMLEAVCLAKVMKAQEFIDLWGAKAKELVTQMGADNTDMQYVSVWDYTDYDRRVVLATLQGSETALQEATSAGVEVYNEEHELPFLPWVARVGGTQLESLSQYQRKPLLEPLTRSGMWETQNIAETLMTSETIAYAAAPRGKKIGINPDTIETDYGEPNRDVEVGPGQDYQRLPPPEIDQNLMALADRIGGRTNKATVARFLQNLDFPSGAAFATVNAVIQSATTALTPYKELAEFALADVCVQMLQWIDHTGDPLLAYGGKDNAQILVRGGKEPDFDVDNLYINVELTPDVPTDRLQRINAGVMMRERLNFPLKRVYEDLNVPDATKAIEEYQEEQLMDVAMQGEMAAMQQEIQMMLQMQMLAAQQAMQGPQGPVSPTVPSPDGAGIIPEQLGGEGFNPALGGIPPAMGAPEELTREIVNQQDAAGQELVR